MVGWKWDPFDIILICAGTFGPTVAGLLLQWFAHGNLRMCRLWTGWVNLLRGLGFGLAAMVLMSVAGPALALAKAPWTALHWGAFFHWSSYGLNYSSLLGGPLGEEPGWRGFALPRMQARLGRLRATLLLALLWTGWHLPLFLMHGWISLNPWQFLLTLTGFGMVLTVAANLARFGVLVAIILHLVFNTSSGIVTALLHDMPTRQHDAAIATLAMFLSGTLIGLLGFLLFRPALTDHD